MIVQHNTNNEAIVNCASINYIRFITSSWRNVVGTYNETEVSSYVFAMYLVLCATKQVHNLWHLRYRVKIVRNFLNFLNYLTWTPYLHESYLALLFQNGITLGHRKNDYNNKKIPNRDTGLG